MTMGAQCRAWPIGMIFPLAMSLAQADSRLGSDQVLELVARGDVLAVIELVTLHPELAEQEWLDIELEREDDRWIYELELLDADGVVREYRYDARTGLSLGFEIED